MSGNEDERYQVRLDRLTDILADIAGHAQEVSKDRCPYMAVTRACTAQFRCRNQQPAADVAGGSTCGHDGTFDYRSAWESRPDSYEKTREKLRRIREEADAARQARRGTAGPHEDGAG